MAKGAVAKTAVEKKIAEAFGEDYIGNFEKKLYVWSNDGGERVQIAISLTCPKNYVGKVETQESGDYDFSDDVAVSPVQETIEVTEKEKEDLASLLAKFGL